MNIMERVEATQKTIDAYIDQPFQWGTADCGTLASDHLIHCGIDTPYSKIKGYTDESGAKRALVKLKAKSMEEVIDQLGLVRIAPAAALPGDIIGLPGGTEEDQWTALGIAIGNSSVIAFANEKCSVGPVDVCTVAWRVA